MWLIQNHCFIINQIPHIMAVVNYVPWKSGTGFQAVQWMLNTKSFKDQLLSDITNLSPSHLIISFLLKSLLFWTSSYKQQLIMKKAEDIRRMGLQMCVIHTPCQQSSVCPQTCIQTSAHNKKKYWFINSIIYAAEQLSRHNWEQVGGGGQQHAHELLSTWLEHTTDWTAAQAALWWSAMAPAQSRWEQTIRLLTLQQTWFGEEGKKNTIHTRTTHNEQVI